MKHAKPENVMKTPNRRYSIKDVTEHFKVSTMTIRAWEKKLGFIPRRDKTSNFRFYLLEDFYALERLRNQDPEDVPMNGRAILQHPGNLPPLDYTTFRATWKPEDLPADTLVGFDTVDAAFEQAVYERCKAKYGDPTDSRWPLSALGKPLSADIVVRLEAIKYCGAPA